MILRKGLALLMGVLIILSSTLTVHATQVSMNLVILVSDNEADMAVAKNVAGILGARVVVSPWGTYNPVASAEILTINPDRVIIIGGPVAVPEEYPKDLESFGIPYERWYGETRYETNLAVIKMLKEEFREAFEEIKYAIIVNGRDAIAIEAYSTRLLSEFFSDGTDGKSILILTDVEKADETIQALDELNSLVEVKYAATYSGTINLKPMFPLNDDLISSYLKKRFGSDYYPSMDMLAPYSTAVYQLLVNVQNKTNRAEKLLDGLQIPDARKKLDEAKKFMTLAWAQYKEGNYAMAYELAMKANFDADFVISRSYSEINTIYQGSAKLQMTREILQLEIMVNVLQKKGYDVTEIKALIEQAKEALNKGDYTTLLKELIPRIKTEIAQLTLGRPIPRVPGGKDRGRP